MHNITSSCIIAQFIYYRSEVTLEYQMLIYKDTITKVAMYSSVIAQLKLYMCEYKVKVAIFVDTKCRTI